MTAFLGTNRAAGLFLDVAQSGQSGYQTGQSGAVFDAIEDLATRALETLRGRPRTVGRWRAELELPDKEFAAVLALLTRLGMVTVHGKGDGATVERSPDADAKRILARLASGPAPAAAVQLDLNLSDPDFAAAHLRLREVGMLRDEPADAENMLALTDFAHDALKVFRVA